MRTATDEEGYRYNEQEFNALKQFIPPQLLPLIIEPIVNPFAAKTNFLQDLTLPNMEIATDEILHSIVFRRTVSWLELGE